MPLGMTTTGLAEIQPRVSMSKSSMALNGRTSVTAADGSETRYHFQDYAGLVA